MPRSNTYALSVFRSSSVASAFLDFAVTDATGKTLVPRMQVALQPNAQTLASLRREGPAPEQLTEPEAPKKGKRSGRSKVAVLYMGRRKGVDDYPGRQRVPVVRNACWSCRVC